MFTDHPSYKADVQRATDVADIGRLSGKTVLVTGATGLIGVHLIDTLMQLGNVNVIATGRSAASAGPRIGSHYASPRFRFAEHDACLPFDESLTADYIIPLASNTHPLAYSQHPVETATVNVLGAKHALDLAVRCHATVLYPSTVEVYGNARGEDVFTEDYTGTLNLSTARSCYTESKRCAEALCLSYAAQYGVEVKTARLSRVFGPTMLPTDTKASSQFLTRAVRGEDIVLKSEGTQLYSYTYVTDAVAAMLHIMMHGENATAYNISNRECDVRLKDFAQTAADCAGTHVVFDLPTETERRGYSIAQRAILDNRRLLATGFRPAYTMREAVERTIEILSYLRK